MAQYEVALAARLFLPGKIAATSAAFSIVLCQHLRCQARALADLAAPFAVHDYEQYCWFRFNDAVTLQTAAVPEAPPTWTGAAVEARSPPDSIPHG